MKEIIFGIVGIVGIILVVLAQISAIGLALYNWGLHDMAIGLALWTSFILWIKMLVGGLVLWFIGMVGIK